MQPSNSHTYNEIKSQTEAWTLHGWGDVNMVIEKVQDESVAQTRSFASCWSRQLL